jgi:outer membrane protein assembly factor BamE (lipoprotein component of BamABCDE complex)
MKSWTAILSVCAIVLTGCAATVGSRVTPGMTESEVLSVGGKPALEHKMPGGETAWDYTLQPSGYFTWRVLFGRDGRVSEVRNLTTYENSLKLAPGMTEAEVRGIMGPTFIREAYWTGNYSVGYRYMDDATFMILTVLMSKDGRVTGYYWEPDGFQYDAVSEGHR